MRLALTAKALVIAGGPGVGKMTIVNSILTILAAKGDRLMLCAPGPHGNRVAGLIRGEQSSGDEGEYLRTLQSSPIVAA